MGRDTRIRRRAAGRNTTIVDGEVIGCTEGNDSAFDRRETREVKVPICDCVSLDPLAVESNNSRMIRNINSRLLSLIAHKLHLIVNSQHPDLLPLSTFLRTRRINYARL